MGTYLANAVRGIYYAILQPSELVSVPGRQDTRSITTQVSQLQTLVVVYLVNLALYAGPLTAAGIGVQSEGGLPPLLSGIFGSDSSQIALFIAGFLQNSVYLFGVTLATLIGIHLALVVTLQSKGFLRTAYSIVYSTSAYLAGVFTIVWYLTTAPSAQNARQFIINVQVEAIYIVLDQVQPGLSYGIERPASLFPGELSTTGEYAIVALVVLMLYYFYSLYLGARLNHDAGRFGGIVAVLVVAAIPVAYIVGSAIAATSQGILG